MLSFYKYKNHKSRQILHTGTLMFRTINKVASERKEMLAKLLFLIIHIYIFGMFFKLYDFMVHGGAYSK